jgi:hypothetical protein
MWLRRGGEIILLGAILYRHVEGESVDNDRTCLVCACKDSDGTVVPFLLHYAS